MCRGCGEQSPSPVIVKCTYLLMNGVSELKPASVLNFCTNSSTDYNHSVIAKNYVPT